MPFLHLVSVLHYYWLKICYCKVCYVQLQNRSWIISYIFIHSYLFSDNWVIHFSPPPLPPPHPNQKKKWKLRSALDKLQHTWYLFAHNWVYITSETHPVFWACSFCLVKKTLHRKNSSLIYKTMIKLQEIQYTIVNTSVLVIF